MTWVRGSDKSGSHPQLMDVAELSDADDRSVNEMMGFLFRLSTFSGAHKSDYVVSLGTVQMVGTSRWRVLLEQAITIGLAERLAVGDRVVVKLSEVQEFLHLRLSDEIEWEKARKRDTTNRDLTARVRLRDGDGCRYCGEVVNWNAHTGNRYGTYDHRTPGKAARHVGDMFVCCGRCNARRKDNPNADKVVPRLPAPETPYYSAETRQFLADRGYPLDKVSRPRQTDDTPQDHAPATRQRPNATSPGTTEPQRPAPSADHADHTSDAAAPQGRARKRGRRGRGSRNGPEPSAGTGL